ncbi:2-amino-4-hydroxy-6-hydroxymethyldihydropteridine diphosphokinase [Myxococcota bacterium]|nr:2-amino-4-hydroxy-6-hydroxymethyldihydropteridine diphosphokinase [Myxococcota bacterium]MBU1381937.1 2-amino-4-hydroxy-6-hydroxymethyldihydropteridine diphosphokinase [Myxococcota bacterium]MBU1497838.1 2-amino-4-hydroxy-6-hydroxymethyldihydropteridine diphosphokinase [Myxococcota bacterium]
MISTSPKTVFLGLGSNIEPRKSYLDSAIAKLKLLENVIDVTCSRIYETKPLGNSLNNYLNMAVKLSVKDLEPLGFLRDINSIEVSLGRIRKEKWGDRTIDIDILMWDTEIIREKDLTVPHPEMTKRLFVLDPLMDLDPHWVHPVEKRTISEIWKNIKGEK